MKYDIVVCNLRREKPQFPYDVRIDRGHSPLANPFRISRLIDRDESLLHYLEYLDRVTGVSSRTAEGTAVIDEFARLMSKFQQYRRLRLFCWCAPLPCHGDLVAKIIRDTLAEFEAAPQRN